MLDIKNLRDNFKDIQISLKKRGYDLNETSFKSLDDSRKELQIEVCKFAKDSVTKSDLNSEKLGELYLDDFIDGLFDLRSLSSSFEGASSLMYLINGSMKGLDGYIKRLILSLIHI